MDLKPLCQDPDMNRPPLNVKFDAPLDDSDTEYYWSSEVDSDSEKSFKKGFSLQQNQENGVKRCLGVKIKIKPERFFPSKNGYKKEKKVLGSVLNPQRSHLKHSSPPDKEDHAARQCANFICEIGGPEVQVAILTRICQLLWAKFPMSPVAFHGNDYIPVRVDMVPLAKWEAIRVIKPLLDEVLELASGLTWRSLISTLQRDSEVKWTDVFCNPCCSQTCGISKRLMKPAYSCQAGSSHHGGEGKVKGGSKKRQEAKYGKEAM